MLSPNEIEVIKEQAYVGVSSSFSNICDVYPLTIKEIVKMGTSRYYSMLGLLLLTEAEIVEIVKEKTGEVLEIENVEPLSYLLQNAEYSDMFLLELQECFSTFIKEEIMLLPQINSVLVGDFSKKKLITPSNFRDFQDILRIQNKRKIEEAPPPDESPIARKFRLKREARDAAKRKQQQKKGETQSFEELMEIADTFKIDYQNRTLFAFYNLIQRHQAKEKWEQDIQMLCAGADSQKLKTKYWGESLAEK